MTRAETSEETRLRERVEALEVDARRARRGAARALRREDAAETRIARLEEELRRARRDPLPPPPGLFARLASLFGR